MLEEQYRRSEKVRLKNKQEERLLQHEIDSHRGMRDVHRYRLEIVKREQKEISRELDRIRMGIKRNLNMSPNLSESTKQNFDGVRKANQSHYHQKVNLTPRRNQCAKLKSLSLNLSRRQMSFDDALENAKDDADVAIEIKLEEEEGKKNEDDSDNDSNSDNYSGFDDEEESIPDPDILKAIMNGIVCNWEQNVMQTISSNQNNTKKKMHLGVKTSKYRRDNDLSPYSNATESITPRKSLAWNSERDPNLKATPGYQPLSTSNYHHGDRRKNYSSFFKRQRSWSASVKSEKQTSGKHEGAQFNDTPDRRKEESLSKPQNQTTPRILDTKVAVAGRENVTKPRVVNQVSRSFDRQRQTHHQSGLHNQKEGTRDSVTKDKKNYKLFKSKLPTLDRQVGDRRGTALRGAISTKKIPTESTSYSARDNILVDRIYSSKGNIDTALSSRSDGHRTMRSGVQFSKSVKISSNFESVDDSDSVEYHPTTFDFTLSRKRNLKDDILESSTPFSSENMGQSGPGEANMIERKRERNGPGEKGSGMFVDKSIYKNPKLHIFKK